VLVVSSVFFFVGFAGELGLSFGFLPRFFGGGFFSAVLAFAFALAAFAFSFCTAACASRVVIDTLFRAPRMSAGLGKGRVRTEK